MRIGEKPKSNAGRKCTICAHKDVEQINRQIANGNSFRAISCQIAGNESARESVRRHTENCLKLDMRAVTAEKKLTQAVNHYQEITEQLLFAKELRIAAREYLSDEHGKLILIPRTEEIDVVYTEFVTKNEKPGWVKKTERLDVLLEKVEDADLNVQRTVAKHVDIRSFALDAIRTVDTVLDKFAKIEGLYQKDNEQKNPHRSTDEDVMRELYKRMIERYNWTHERTIKTIAEAYPAIDIERFVRDLPAVEVKGVM